MEKKDLHFIKRFAFVIESIVTSVFEVLTDISHKGEYAFSREYLEKRRKNCMESLKESEKYADESGKSLVKAMTIFVEDIFSDEAMNIDDKKGLAVDDNGNVYACRGKDVFIREDLRLSSFRLSDEIGNYQKEKHLNVYKDLNKMTLVNELAMAILFQQFQFFLTELNALDRRMDMTLFEEFFSTIEHHQVDASGDDFYLVRNKKGQILCYENDERKYVYVYEKEIVDKFKDIPSKSYNKKSDIAVVDRNLFEETKKKIRNEYYDNKKKEKEKTKTDVKKEDNRKVKTKKKLKINWKGMFSFFEDFTISDIVLGIIPTLIMITYVILLVTGVMDKITFSSSGFDGTLFGYNFELSGLMANWLENTDHGFFSAITLGLIQVILIVVGFVLDLVIHVLFLILALLWLLLILIFSMCFYYVFPVAIAVWSIINFFRADDDKKVLAGVCMAISVIGCISYFLIGMNVI